MNALVWSFFLTKLSKYLWIKTGDRHYHFVEPWFMDIPFCRMETMYHNQFVEQKARPLQKWSTATPPREWQRGSSIGLYRSMICEIKWSLAWLCRFPWSWSAFSHVVPLETWWLQGSFDSAHESSKVSKVLERKANVSNMQTTYMERERLANYTICVQDVQ